MESKQEIISKNYQKILNLIHQTPAEEIHDWYGIVSQIQACQYKDQLYLEMMKQGQALFYLIPEHYFSLTNIERIFACFLVPKHTLNKSIIIDLLLKLLRGNQLPRLKYYSHILDLAVSVNGLALELIPPQFLTPALCMIAIRENPRALEFVPKYLGSKDLYKLALHKELMTYRFITPAPKELIKEVLAEKLELAELEHQQLFFNFFNKLSYLYKKLSMAEIYRLNIHTNIYKFFVANEKKIINLQQLFGLPALHFLNSLLVSSPVPLERFLDSYLPLPPEETWFISNLLKEISIKKQWSKRETKDTALCLTFLATINSQVKKNIITEMKSKQFKHIKDFQIFVYKHNSKYCFDCLGLNLKNINYEKVEKYFSIEWLNELRIGINSLTQDSLPLFANMLRADLEVGHSFRQFCTDLEQEAKLGRQLACHNRAIHTILAQAEIDVDRALHFQEKSLFYYGENFQQFKQQKLIWANLLEIKFLLLNEKENNALGALKSINNISNQLLKGSRLEYPPLELPEPILKKFNKNIIELIEKLINSLLQKNYKQAQLEKMIQELNINVKNIKEQDKKPVQKFRIEQWDKSRPDTFFLGNYLSCCLATNGREFDALLERRMDDACLMHVVINEETNEPICGNWLFFAQNAACAQEVYLVANFFEIKIAYTTDKKLRDLLVNSLKEFTAYYAYSIGAKDFLLRPLTYGTIPDFIDLPLKNIAITKVGDFFITAEGITDNRKNGYYLEALYEKTFYSYGLPEKQLVKKQKREIVQTHNFFKPDTQTQVISQDNSTKHQVNLT